MKKYESKEFINALAKKMNGRDVPSCPYCGGQRFTSTDKMTTILIGDDVQSINLGLFALAQLFWASYYFGFMYLKKQKMIQMREIQQLMKFLRGFLLKDYILPLRPCIID